jgi:hypothetical protein
MARSIGNDRFGCKIYYSHPQSPSRQAAFLQNGGQEFSLTLGPFVLGTFWL